uniref:tRNA (uracil-O(2)-)-methyltransferase n=1 Tax=Ornithodoros turicata TaxID=34597 RepID=A0A2R5LLH1_9ACAR
MWTHVAVSDSVLNLQRFRESVLVWVEKPHTVNRRLTGVLPLAQHRLADFGDETDLYSFAMNLESMDVPDMNAVLSSHKSCGDTDIDVLRSVCGDSRPVLVERYLLPKQMHKFKPVHEVVLITRDCAMFCNFSKGSTLSPNCTYRIRLDQDKRIHLELLGVGTNTDAPAVTWLKEHVLHKIYRWSCSEPLGSKQVAVASLRLTPIEKYSRVYFNLKKKYGAHLCKIWPETTDPSKFVYEDIAIASYLITLWEQDLNGSARPSFIDVGCGNGLLVYLLSAEGYNGMGIDIRKRKIWDLYGPDINLVEGVITPTSRFSEYTWWIGNHSDELTPWIPYLASRSHADARVFLLPCCPFTFDGKYQRQHGGMSQYQSYLLFLQELCQTMGFEVELDRLRIPSTKRIALICKPASDDQVSTAQLEDARLNFVKENTVTKQVPEKLELGGASRGHEEVPDSDSFASVFKPRSKVEEVRNCTQLEKEFTQVIVDRIAIHLLQMEPVNDLSDTEPVWQQGGREHIGSLVHLLNDNELQKLKKQCGGLQTLLKNHRHVFLVHSGHASLNIPTSQPQRTTQRRKGKACGTSQKRAKLKECWFFKKHPQGCPLTDEECLYRHGR